MDCNTTRLEDRGDFNTGSALGRSKAHLKFLGQQVGVGLVLGEEGVLGQVVIIAFDVLQVDVGLSSSVGQTHNFSSALDKGLQLVHHCFIFALGVDEDIWLPCFDLRA